MFSRHLFCLPHILPSGYAINSLDGGIKSTLVAVGIWQNCKVILLSLPTLEAAINEELCVETLPRDILMAYMEKIMYLLVALGDGSLFYYVIDPITSKESAKHNINNLRNSSRF